MQIFVFILNNISILVLTFNAQYLQVIRDFVVLVQWQ